MNISILIPHYKVGKITAYCVAKLLQHKGNHEMEIIVVDNNAGDGSAQYLDPFLDHITIVDYPLDRLQSHGVSFDFVLPKIKNEYFLTLESDSFPTRTGWLDYYEFLISQDFDSAGSFLELSGGYYQHPCGSLYRKSVWEEAMKFVDELPYYYFPNAAMKEGFPCHLMVHDKHIDEFIKTPSKFVVPSEGYRNETPLHITEKMEYYMPIGKGVFHNGMGALQESIKTFWQRNLGIALEDMDFSKADDLIFRIGSEPGQFFSYWMKANNKKIYSIPTTVKWLEGRENQNQEYTMMENGFTHCWGISAYHKVKLDGLEDVVEFKRKQAEGLYNSLPANQKIPAIADGVTD